MRCGERLDFATYFILTAVALIPLWLFRFLPLQDYPDWLFQGYLFSQILSGKPSPDYQLVPAPVPNSISSVVIGLLGLVVPAEVAGKLFLSAAVALFCFGSIYLLNALTPERRSLLGYSPFLFVFNHPFYHGNLNYYFSLGLLFAGTGYVIRRRLSPSRLSALALFGFTILIYFSHLLSYLVWLIFLGNIYLANPRPGFWRKAGSGVLFSLALGLIYMIHQLSGPASANLLAGVHPGFNPHSHLNYLYRSGMEYLALFPSFYPFPLAGFLSERWLAAVNGAFALALIVLLGSGILALLLGAGKETAIPRTALALLLLYLISPPQVGEMVRPGQRFILPALWLILTALAPVLVFPRRSPWNLPARAVIVLLCLGQLSIHWTEIHSVSDRLESVYRKIQAVGQEEFKIVAESHFAYERRFPASPAQPKFLPRHFPLMRLPYYWNIEVHSSVPIFSTGIFRELRAEPDLQSVSAVTRYSGASPYLLILGENKGNHFIAAWLMEKYAVVSEGECHLILKRN